MTVALFLRDRGSWSPLSLSSSLAAWYRADAGCYTDAACRFASASSQYLSKSSPTFAPTTKMTIAFDYKPTTIGAYQTLSARWNAGPTQAQFVVYVTTAGVIQVYIANALTDAFGNSAQGTAVLTAGVNYRIVVVYDGTLAAANRVAIYIDGVADMVGVSGTIPTSLTSSTAALSVGNDFAGSLANGAIARLGFSSLALSGAALTAAHTSTFWADMTAARQADWFSFYNLCEASSTRVDSTGLNNLTPTNGPTVAAGPGEGLCVDNSPVKRWESGYGVAHLLQATIGKQPRWIASGQNGLPTVRFDGSTANILATAGFTLNQPEDLFFVGKFVGSPSSNATIFDGSSVNLMRVFAPSTTTIQSYAGNLGPSLTPSDINAFHAYRFLFNGASSVASEDAGSNATGDTGASNSGGITMGARGDDAENGSVEIGEALFASSVVSAASSAKSYLKSRWNTP